jgi:hypothetical protein
VYLDVHVRVKPVKKPSQVSGSQRLELSLDRLDMTAFMVFAVNLRIVRLESMLQGF